MVSQVRHLHGVRGRVVSHVRQLHGSQENQLTELTSLFFVRLFIWPLRSMS